MNSMIANRNQQIEGLRGLAILIIVFYHMISRYVVIYQSNIKAIDSFLIPYWGQIGVLIFFTISIWFMNEGTNSLKQVLIRNIFRLYPEYIVSIVIIYIIGAIWGGYLPGRIVDLKTFIINVTMLEGFIPGIDYVDGAHWYLTVLISITIIMTLIRVYGNDSTVCYLCWLIVSIILHVLGDPFIKIGVILASEYVGVVVCVVCCKKIVINNSKQCIMEIITALFGMFYMSIQNILYVFFMLCIIAIFLCAYYKKIFILENRFLLNVARISYPIYLTHQNIGFIVQNVLSANRKYSYVFCIAAICIDLLVAFGVFKTGNFLRRFMYCTISKKNSLN